MDIIEELINCAQARPNCRDCRFYGTKDCRGKLLEEADREITARRNRLGHMTGKILGRTTVIPGFIRVHNSRDNNKEVVINAAHIVEIVDDVVYLDIIEPEDIEHNYITCQESYEELCAKLAKAMGVMV